MRHTMLWLSLIGTRLTDATTVARVVTRCDFPSKGFLTQVTVPVAPTFWESYAICVGPCAEDPSSSTVEFIGAVPAIATSFLRMFHTIFFAHLAESIPRVLQQLPPVEEEYTVP